MLDGWRRFIKVESATIESSYDSNKIKGGEGKEMIRYKVIESQLELEGQKYTGYGIVAEDNGTLIEIMEDVSLNKEEIEELVRRCNEGSLELIHLKDVVDDFLVSCSL